MTAGLSSIDHLPRPKINVGNTHLFPKLCSATVTEHDVKCCFSGRTRVGRLISKATRGFCAPFWPVPFRLVGAPPCLLLPSDMLTPLSARLPPNELGET